MKKRFSEEQIVAILREGQMGQKTIEQLCRKHGVSQPTYYLWKRKYAYRQLAEKKPCSFRADIVAYGNVFI